MNNYKRNTRINLSLLPILIFFIFSSIGKVSATETVEIVASEDAQVYDKEKNTNYGSRAYLELKAEAEETEMETSKADFSNRQFYLKFNADDVNPESFNRAKIKLKVRSVEADSYRTLWYIKPSDNNWTESSLTWNNKPTVSEYQSDFIASSVSVEKDQFVYFDVSDYVFAKLAQGNKTLSFHVSSTTAGNRRHNYLTTFYSKEEATAANRPQLVFEDSDEPVVDEI
ncbi:MAG: DNRLRE domain-containing protein, partial [Dysgonamonadaceae bacterium]|nr:DNRLRE domain-containing protein [Dysgonamonadaceae bacterium]